MNGDQAVADPLIITFPKTDVASKEATLVIGDQGNNASMSWCFASAYLLATPIGIIRQDTPTIHTLTHPL